MNGAVCGKTESVILGLHRIEFKYCLSHILDFRLCATTQRLNWSKVSIRAMTYFLILSTWSQVIIFIQNKFTFIRYSLIRDGHLGLEIEYSCLITNETPCYIEKGVKNL